MKYVTFSHTAFKNLKYYLMRVREKVFYTHIFFRIYLKITVMTNVHTLASVVTFLMQFSEFSSGARSKNARYEFHIFITAAIFVVVFKVSVQMTSACGTTTTEVFFPARDEFLNAASAAVLLR